MVSFLVFNQKTILVLLTLPTASTKMPVNVFKKLSYVGCLFGKERFSKLRSRVILRLLDCMFQSIKSQHRITISACKKQGKIRK